MADYLVTDTELTSIADAIRTKGGTSADLSFPTEFVSAINDIQTGSSPAPKKDVNFIDYDGTILHSYTASEFQNLSAFPSNPIHDGLISQGWNWSLENAKAQMVAQPNDKLYIGQMYITASGDTEIDVGFDDSARLSPILTIAVNGTVSIDWGDNTTNTQTGTSLTTILSVSHTYASKGSYTIKVSVITGSFQFYGSTTSTLLRKNTTSNENMVYSNCVKAVRFGNGVTSIGAYAFANCWSIENITIPHSVTSIGSYAFNVCYSLKSLTIPSSVTAIGDYTFATCSALANIAIPHSVTSIAKDAFAYCHSLENIALPSGVTSIGEQIVYDCRSLKSITIPSGATTIGSQAFAYCYCIASITIPSSITSITGTYVFNGMYGLKEVHIKPTTPPTLSNKNAFYYKASDLIIYVPSASLSTYKSATNWSNYASQMVGE